jgi:trehalose/maltose transport system permease protein
VTTFLSVLFGSFAGFALGKLRFRGKAPAGYAILAMTMFPQITILSGLYALMYNFGISSYTAMILSDLLFTLPLATWLMTSYFKHLPIELLEASRVDGATFFQTFYLILVPLTAPAVVTTGLLTFIGTWNEYLFALTFTVVSPKARTVPVAIALFKGIEIHHVPFGEIMAGMVIVTIPIVILVLIFQRRIVAGLTAGAVKG